MKLGDIRRVTRELDKMGYANYGDLEVKPIITLLILLIRYSLRFSFEEPENAVASGYVILPEEPKEEMRVIIRALGHQIERVTIIKRQYQFPSENKWLVEGQFEFFQSTPSGYIYDPLITRAVIRLKTPWKFELHISTPKHNFSLSCSPI